jgi:Family of unknown function (DUF6155)
MNKKELKKFITTLSNEELQGEIIKLFEKFDQVKHFYTAELSNDTQALLSKYKQKIEKEFQRASTRSSNSYRITEINNIIKEFEKVSVFSIDIIELKLYRVELAIKLVKDFRIDDQTYYASIAGHYQKVLKQIRATHLEDYFTEKTDAIKLLLIKRDIIEE